MSRRFRRVLGVSGARAVAAALVAAGAALGGNAGAPGWLRIVFGVLALVVAIAVVGLTWAEQMAGGRAQTQRLRGWVEGHFGPRGRGVPRKSERGHYLTTSRGVIVPWASLSGG